MPAGSEGTGRLAPRRRSSLGTRTIRPGQTAPPVLQHPPDQGAMYGGPTSWRDELAARLVFWFKAWLVPSLRLVVSILFIAYLGWCLLPPLVTHYLLHDDMVDIARRPLDDGETRRLIMEAIARRGVTKRLGPADITLQTNPSGKKRNIGFSYQAELELIPGRVHRFELSINVTEPVMFQPKTRHF